MLAGPSCAASGLSNKWNGTECFYTVRCWDFRDIYTAASKLLLYVWILEWCWSRLLHLLKPIKPEQASTVSVLILIFAESVDCKIPISGIFDDFLHLHWRKLHLWSSLYWDWGPTGILASCHVCLRLSSLFVMMSHSSWGTTTRRMVSEKWEKWFQKSSKTNSCWSSGSIWRKGTDRGCNRLCQERQNLSGFSMCFIYLYMSCW